MLELCPSVVVLDACFCPEAAKIGWSGLGNRTIRFGGHRKLVPASIRALVFTPRTIFCFAATSSRFLSASGFASPSVKVSLLSLVFPWLPLTDQ
jgi:hypothetical protein